MYIPRLADRLNCMIFRRRFDQELKEILPELDIIQMAITELKESTRFKRVLKVIKKKKEKKIAYLKLKTFFLIDGTCYW